MFQIPNWKTVNKLHIFKWLKKNTALKALHSHSLSVEKCTRWCTQKKTPASATTFIFFRKCLCDLALLLILEGGWELDEHFHCPHTRCWRQLLLRDDYCFQWGVPARTTTDWVPDRLQISSAKDDDMDPNHPTSPTAAQMSSSRKQAIKPPPFFWKGHQGVFVGQQDLQTVIFALDWFILKVVVHLVPIFIYP